MDSFYSLDFDLTFDFEPETFNTGTLGLPKGGNFIYPMMHRFILYYQASERTWSDQFNRDATVEQRWKVTCVADKTFCTFAVSIYLRFSFYYSKYISC